jgi:DNA-binding GntR family transcriptional regulator
MTESNSAVRVVPLHTQALERLRMLIIRGDLKPGTRVQEAEICERLGISRTPLREALKVLAAEGFVHLLPNRGARIAQLSREQLSARLELCIAVETYCIGEIGRRARHVMAALERSHERLLAAFHAGDASGFFQENLDFHREIVAGLRNEVLLGVWDGAAAHLARARNLQGHQEDFREEAVADHEAIMAALRAGDATRAEELLRSHHSKVPFLEGVAKPG